MVATSGDVLLAPDAIEAVKRELIPLATIITPNLPEAARLLGAQPAASEAEAVAQGKALRFLGCDAVLIKGGHAEGEEAVDYLCDGAGIERFVRPRVDTPHTHGTGCTLSAAIAALMAQGVACGRRSAAPRTTCGEGWRPAARWASGAATARSIISMPSAAARRRPEP